jgi:hypothetical protein
LAQGVTRPEFRAPERIDGVVFQNDAGVLRRRRLIRETADRLPA